MQATNITPGAQEGFSAYRERLLYAYRRRLPQDDDFLRSRHGAQAVLDDALEEIGRSEYGKFSWREQLDLRQSLSVAASKFGYPEVHNLCFEDRFEADKPLNKRIFLRPTQDPDKVLVKGDYYLCLSNPDGWCCISSGLYTGREAHDLFGKTIYSPVLSNGSISSLMGLMLEHEPQTVEFRQEETPFDQENMEKLTAGDPVSVTYWPRNYKEMELGTYPFRFDGVLKSVDPGKRVLSVNRLTQHGQHAENLELSRLPLTRISKLEPVSD